MFRNTKMLITVTHACKPNPLGLKKKPDSKKGKTIENKVGECLWTGPPLWQFLTYVSLT